MHDKRHKAYLEGKLQNIPQYAHPFEHVQLMRERLTLPLKWKQPRTVFVNSVSDLFHEEVPFDFIDQVFAVMALTPQHTYQILTKRPERMVEYLNHRSDGLDPDCEGMVLDAAYRMGLVIWDDRGDIAYRYSKPVPSKDQLAKRRIPPHWPLSNVWLGTSVENQATADERIPHLLKCPAAVRFLSCEPLLGPVDIKFHLDLIWKDQGIEKPIHPDDSPGLFTGLNWVIAGGESGPGARPMHADWARGLRDQCKAAGVAFFFKQWGAYCHGKPGSKKDNGRMLDGVEHSEWPATASILQET
jgi:protein gp37